MSKRAWIVLAATLGSVPCLAGADQPFDGTWTTIVSCPNYADALGYTYDFQSTVKNGRLSGTQGSVGQAGSLHLEGTIDSDGDARLMATGSLGARNYTPGQQTPRGTNYAYEVAAHFGQRSGTGIRTAGRPCSLTFERQ
jgi:hypothetical protein